MAQHQSKMMVELDPASQTLRIQQEITFINQTNDTLSSLVLNDWNTAYSNKNTPLANRFSDEFYRGFHLATEAERGGTSNLTILNVDTKEFWQSTPLYLLYPNEIGRN